MNLSAIQSLVRAAFAAAALTLASLAGQSAALAQDSGYVPPQSDQGPRSLTPPRQVYGGASNDNPGYGQPYAPPQADVYRREGEAPQDYSGPPPQPDTYSSDEILDAGHHFFGSVSEGLARVVEYAFRKQGRPNGYILGDEAGGAVFAGLRYGEGVLHTKGFGVHKVYWQGPSLGYDFGGNGSKTLTLVYNLRDPRDIYERFAGVEGSAYLIGGVGITFQQHDNVILAPIRAGVGLRLGANIGYLKYTPSPTWNPF